MRDARVDLSDVVDGWMGGLMMSLFSPVYKFLVVLSFTQNCMVNFYILVNLGCWFFNASVHASASWTPHAFSFYAFKNDQSEALSYTKGGAFPNFHFLLYSAFEKLPCEISLDATIWN